MVSVIQSAKPGMRFHQVVCGQSSAKVQVAHFSRPGGVAEFHLMITPTVYADIGIQADGVREAYRDACAQLGLESDTAVFCRFFCSDLPNQASILASKFSEIESRCAVSWVTQPPAPPAKIALWASHVQAPGTKLDIRKEDETLFLLRGELTHCWTTGLQSPHGKTSYEQTALILAHYENSLLTRGLTVADHVLRTWFFVQNVDANYQGLVTARREFFSERGLTAETHYIASTGIEGTSADVTANVMLDAYAIAGVRQEQIAFLSAPDHLCPTHRYGVTFERGVSVAYADRKHVFISGTASIDHNGGILHPGDVQRQLTRALENVAALLAQAGAAFADVGMFIVYARDISDLALLQQMMTERFGDVPLQVVLAPVCRPGWLVEVECQAIVAADNRTLPAF